MPNREKKENRIKEKTTSVQYVTVDEAQSGRRIDNFLQLQLKGLPKARIYQMLRKGEVRLNGSRVKQHQRIDTGDVVRIPPVRLQAKQSIKNISSALINRVKRAIIHEDEQLLVLNKPSGITVHSGSGQHYGIIEIIRKLRPDLAFIELAHRLDRDTSGCLVLVKNANVLRDIQAALKNQETEKYYLAFTQGEFKDGQILVDQPLKKGLLSGGERMVHVHPDGKPAKTLFNIEKQYSEGALLKVELLTGRTHQIRVHANYLGHPLAMDGKYGDREFNKQVKSLGLKRLFLHANEMSIKLPSGRRHFKAPLPEDLHSFLENLNQSL